MAVDGVDNSNNNTALYTAGAALVGGGAGAGIGYATKSILKDGNYTDEFVSKVHKGILNTDKGKAMSDLFALDPKSETYLTDCANVIKKHAKIFGIDVKELSSADVKIAEMLGGSEQVRDFMESFRISISAELGEEIKLGKESNISEILKKHTPDSLDKVFDRSKNKKAFKSEVNGEGAKEILKLAKDAQKSLKLKAAGIYGAIGAGVLGLGTLLCCSGKKQPEQPQNIDKEA